MEEYVPFFPNLSRPDFAWRAAAWACALTPDLLKRAVPELTVRPRACGLAALAVAEATLRARRGAGQGPMAMSAVIPPGWLDGALSQEDAALLRAVELPADTDSSEELLEKRVAELRAHGPKLPERV